MASPGTSSTPSPSVQPSTPLVPVRPSLTRTGTEIVTDKQEEQTQNNEQLYNQRTGCLYGQALLNYFGVSSNRQ